MRRAGPFRALLRAQARVARRWIASVRTESRLKVVFVGAAAIVVWVAVFGLCYGLLELLERFGRDLLGGLAAGGAIRLTDVLLQRLLAAFSLSVLVLLVLSNALAAYAALFRSREVGFLLQTPIPIATLFLSRFVEIVTFSSWALGFLGAPALLAYGAQRGVSWSYYVALPVLFVPFVVVPAAIGAIAALGLGAALGRLSRRTIVGGAVISLAGLLGLLRLRFEAPDLSQAETVRAILDLLGGTQSPFLPSAWLAEGLFAAAAGDARSAAFAWLLLLANALLLVWLATVAAEALLYRGFTATTEPARSRRRGSSTSASWLETLLRPVGEPARSLAIKDLRLFWRDPVQWSQCLLFFGLMGLYVANMDHRSTSVGGSWRSWIAILNSSATMLILATLTTRFVFPLVSLEGRRFWILGLAPLHRRDVVGQKFWLAAGLTSVPTVGLALLSGLRLRLEPGELAFSLLAVTAATCALCGLSVGLGALYPNLEAESPARIVSGLGGTLNFILSFLFIAVLGAVQAFAVQWRRAHGDGELVTAAAAAGILALSALATWLPLRMGARNLERLEL